MRALPCLRGGNTAWAAVRGGWQGKALCLHDLAPVEGMQSLVV